MTDGADHEEGGGEGDDAGVPGRKRLPRVPLCFRCDVISATHVRDVLVRAAKIQEQMIQTNRAEMPPNVKLSAACHKERSRNSLEKGKNRNHSRTRLKRTFSSKISASKVGVLETLLCVEKRPDWGPRYL